jgi:PiT family inorganic phosphate transporter
MPEHALIWAIVAAALLFDYINGFHDTANAIATTVLTGALSVGRAILLAASLNFLGALINKTVATTIGKGIVEPTAVTQWVVLAAILGAIIWNLITWYFGLPSSSSHALIGGIVGAVIAYKGFGSFKVAGLELIGLALLLSPILGFLVGHLFMVGIYWLFRHFPPGPLNKWFRILQILSASSMALTHGGNDAQKSMGVITMALVAGGYLKSFQIPLWVVMACAASMALGTAGGGWRIIKTVGRKIIGLMPVQGFAAETSGALVILAATHFGAPISTTHTISSAIMGVGTARKFSAIRWGVVQQIVFAWVLTLPCSALFAVIIFKLMNLAGH